MHCKDVNTGQLSTLEVASLFIASGILGMALLAPGRLPERHKAWPQQPAVVCNHQQPVRRTAGEQCSPSVRQLPSLLSFTGEVAYASRHQGEECMLGQEDRVKEKVLFFLPSAVLRHS